MDKFFNAVRSMPLRRGPARMAGGVAGGIADKFGWDLTIVRIIMLLSFLLPGIGIAAYVVAWLLIPAQDNSIILQKWLRAF